MASIFSGQSRQQGTGALRDLAVLAIALTLLIAYFSTGAGHAGEVAQFVARLGAHNSQIVISLLLLNIALTLYAWRRFRDAKRELVERHRLEREARSLASSDPLTGFLNRRSFAHAAAEQIAKAGARQTLTLLIIDIDGFKHINEAHGHHTGDLLLRMSAEVIGKALPSGTVLARLGGDEFAALLSGPAAAPAEAERAADRLVDALGKPFDLGGISIHVSASVGLAQMDGDADTAEALTRRADIAMSAAKKLGRSRSVWFDGSMELELLHRNEVENGLREAIPAGQIVPYFEPQIDLVTQSLHGFEMLARWQHPERGIITPDVFIPVAEESGLIGDLSLSAIRQALEEAKNWDPSLRLSVNISPVQLKDPWLAQKITKLLVETGFPAERLEIEITESCLFENLALAQSIIASLKNQGISLALDDFGTGYSSIAHLRALPFDRIKIDRSFVSTINDNEESAAIITAITRLAESLGLAVTAEGIEDEVVEARLRSIGAYQAQGYMFGKPMPAADVRRVLASRALLPSPRTLAPTEVPVAEAEPRRRQG